MKKNIFVIMTTVCMMIIGTGVHAQNPQQQSRMMIIGTGVHAQNPQQQSRMMKERPTAEQMAQRKTERLKEKLALTEEQAKQVYDYNLQQIKEMQAQREQMRTERQAEAAKMKSILTPEQFEKWQEMQGTDRNRGRMQQDGKGEKHRQEASRDGKAAYRGVKKDNE